MNIKTTTQAAELLGITRKTLLTWLYRHPEYQPKSNLGTSADFLWTDEEIEKVGETRKGSKRGRPKKDKT